MKTLEYIIKNGIIQNYYANLTGKQDFVIGINNIKSLIEIAKRDFNLNLNNYYNYIVEHKEKLSNYLTNKISLSDFESDFIC